MQKVHKAKSARRTSYFLQKPNNSNNTKDSIKIGTFFFEKSSDFTPENPFLFRRISIWNQGTEKNEKSCPKPKKFTKLFLALIGGKSGMMCTKQCDKIGRFMALWATF